jgi:hypothetical protein
MSSSCQGRQPPTTRPATVETFVTAYDAKYDYSYDAASYGPPTVVSPAELMAWRAAGVAGRDGFTHSGKWVSA